MAKKEESLGSIFSRGILRENPVFVLLLGLCPFLAVTTSVTNGLGIGLATTFVLICTNIVISILRNFIPERVRIPVFITIIAGFVTIVELLIKAYAPALDQSLGIFIPLITVNCIVLGRAEAFASHNGPFKSFLDALGAGLGFTIACILMGGIREILGAGTFLGYEIPWLVDHPFLIFIMPTGGFFVYAMLMVLSSAILNWQDKRRYDKEQEILEEYIRSQQGEEATGALAASRYDDDECIHPEEACAGCSRSGGCGLEEYRRMLRPSRPTYRPAVKGPSKPRSDGKAFEGGDMA